jgi:hypothetical protein
MMLIARVVVFSAVKCAEVEARMLLRRFVLGLYTIEESVDWLFSARGTVT